MPDHFDAAGGLERQPHLEYSPVAESRECHDHITPEEQYVRSFSEFQVSQNDKKRSLQEKSKAISTRSPAKAIRPIASVKNPSTRNMRATVNPPLLSAIIDCLHNIIPGKEKRVNKIGYESEFFFCPLASKAGVVLHMLRMSKAKCGNTF